MSLRRSLGCFSTAFVSASAARFPRRLVARTTSPTPPSPHPISSAVSRRSVLHALPLLPLLLHALSAQRAAAAAVAAAADGYASAAAVTVAAASAQVSPALVSLVRLRDSLTQLSDDVEGGTNADVRRVVRTLLRSCDVPKSVATTVKALPPSSREEALLAGRDAFEYLNQVVEYFEATANRERPSAKVLAFLLQCVVTAAERLDVVLGMVDDADIELARQLVVAPVASGPGAGPMSQ